MTRRWPLSGAILAVLWLFIRGVELTPVRLAEEFLIGLLVGLPIAYAFRRFYTPVTPLSRTVRVLPYAVLYVLAFLKEVLTANVDVAYRVLAPSMPIRPAIVEVPLRVRSDLAITTIANSISLTPGTLTMDHDSEANTLYVHSIDGRDRESILAPIRTWENYALVIFDEELKPGDPVPQEATRADGGRRTPETAAFDAGVAPDRDAAFGSASGTDRDSAGSVDRDPERGTDRGLGEVTDGS